MPAGLVCRVLATWGIKRTTAMRGGDLQRLPAPRHAVNGNGIL